MNKHLLLGSALIVAISAYPQAGKQAKRTGIINDTRATYANETPATNIVKPAPVKPVKPAAAAKTSSTIATSCTHFAGSYNAAGVYLNGQECLHYNADVDAVAFIHRSAPCYSTIPNGNSGTQVAKYSTNHGTTWDSTVYYTSTTNLGRYPQGGIYNPAGNTNITNAYIVGMGSTTPGSGWNGSWFASKKITIPGNTTPGTDMQAFPNTAPFGALGKKVDFPRYGFSFTKDGFVRALGEIVNDVNNTTSAPAYADPRGVAIIKGAFSAGAFVWSYDSLVPPTILRSGGSKQLTTNLSDMAWNDAGTVGYVMMLGARAGTSGVMKGYQPIVYKTTNSGASWTLLPANNFATSQFQGLVDRIWATNSNTNLAVPFFSTGEGLDICVDVNDNMHLACTVVGSYSNNNDSLEYTVSWGTEKYSFPYGSFGFPTIYDFYTTSAGGWNYFMVDSMFAEGPSGTSGQGGYAVNPWATSGAPVDARIQVSHSPDRKKIFYSWTDSDTSILGLHWNVYPNIMMRGYDVTIDKVTAPVNITAGVNTPDNADQVSWFHYMSNRSITTNTLLSTNEIPFTISYNNASDINAPTNHYYIKGASFTQADFIYNPMRPVGVQAVANNTPSYEVNNYPNPASGSTTISVNLKEAKNFEISVYSTVGRLIQNMKVEGHVGANNVSLDLSSLSAGVYVYSVKADNSTVTKKFVVE